MASYLGRRKFLATLGGAAAAWPLAARTQHGDRIRRIGVLTALGESDPQGKLNIAAFRRGLQDLGWSEDRNVRIEFHFAAEGASSIQAAAAELTEKAPEVILAHGTAMTAGLQRATRTIPLSFAGRLPVPVLPDEWRPDVIRNCLCRRVSACGVLCRSHPAG
jgi:putative tryptophan/tyrosine transport system substrate-binding protein